MLKPPPPDALPWVLVLMEEGESIDVEFYESRQEAESAAETAIDGTSATSVYIALIKCQASTPRSRR